jgi:hypothetical protein
MTMLVVSGSEIVLDAVEFNDIRRAFPPDAVESRYTPPALLGTNVRDSPSTSTLAGCATAMVVTSALAATRAFRAVAAGATPVRAVAGVGSSSLRETVEMLRSKGVSAGAGGVVGVAGTLGVIAVEIDRLVAVTAGAVRPADALAERAAAFDDGRALECADDECRESVEWVLESSA